MSQKGKGSAGSGKGKKPAKSGAESKGEDVLQAVILADSFQDRFKPFTIGKPRCLLPLGNTPLIEYTLEFLAMNGVNEVYLYCGANTDAVEEHINRSRWSTASKSSPFSLIQFIRVADARSAGDVLRDLDTRSLIDGDFILVHGDLVSNLPLDAVLAAHRRRREESALNIMTCVLRGGGPDAHRTKARGITPIFVIDNKTQRCLHYDEMSALGGGGSGHRTLLDPAIPEELSTDFDVRADLIDAQVDICTPEVLALWSESFDYELPRRNFLHGVLKDWELNGKMIYAHVVDEDGGYAARASDLRMYDAVSRDVLGRWTFPLIPENNLAPGAAYRAHPGGVVIEQSAWHASSARLRNSIVGDRASIGPGATVTNCVIGSGCVIAAGATLTDAFLWNDVAVDEGATVTHAILADGVKIGKGATVQPGALLSFGVRIGDGMTVPEDTAISTLSALGKPVTADVALVGADGDGAAFHDPEADELEDDDPARLQRTLIYSTAGFNVSTSSVSTLASEAYSDDDSSDGGGVGGGGDTAEDAADREAAASKASFHADAVHGLLDALRAASGDFDSAKLEFMGLRLANNASDEMMRRAVATAFARRAARPRRRRSPRAGARSAFALATQAALGEVVQESGLDAARAGTVLAALMQQLYALDVLEEEGILAWWEDGRAAAEGTMAALRDKCRVLVEWLENAEEEEEEEDDDDDDDDSDDDDE
ncbi:eIF4-gamma/eIF5/eIF2-epsilon [Cordyceps fumosorosea ARSEF 2679]|uniref:Translation initiation factor eIF2B subunit epsilon n=1 Tax=Cordyceps fumosorosea (strain ARSEF 2679) TaxID=1081104 RepID=A0A168EBU1_CORFA|nr:eIF4-gamma/eIF5/eIF2-epsilon [Cordyceps fumosorosea ARSEF 2679]OAA73623.1 eIF4-gamma/eIF5/eIF2-epsilon [Cordyceps fumosorosea ARSEF 2679]